ncbi:MAG: cytochrome P450 [Hyphomonadaceae bacterium]|nr:cytochrome P450 [Hyphomonadaceae bacterium]
MTIEDIPVMILDPPEGDHAYIKSLRARSPVARSLIGAYMSFRHADADRIFDDQASRQIELEIMALRGVADGPIFDLMKGAMLTSNGETHRRRRQPVARTFAFKLMDGMRGAIRDLATELVAAHRNKGPMDFMNDFAGQIPPRMIARILGVPESDLPRFMQWIGDTARAFQLFTLEERPRMEASLTAFNAYVGELLDARRADPRDDFLTEYARATAEDGLDENEVRTQVIGLILAGSETTRTSMCAILALLLQHPEQWRAFCADPDGLKKQVVNEGLRYEPVVGAIPRFLKQDFELGGHTIPQGSLVAISLLGALRDPEVYANPDAFDIARTDHTRWHLVFGAGAHRCLGEALARAELEESLAIIARDAPGATLITAPNIRGLGGIRRIDGMEVALA